MMEDPISARPTLPEMMTLLDATMARIEGAYAPSSIRAASRKFSFARVSLTGETTVEGWLSALGETEGFLFRGLLRNYIPTAELGVGQINRIFKRMAKQANVDDALICRITSHSCRVGAAQDLVSEAASLPLLMSKGRWGKSDTVMRYVEQVGFVA